MTSIGHTLPQTSALAEDTVRRIDYLVRVRLVTGVLLLLGGLVGLLGLDWDIQWHSVIGRDRTFTPPHDMILTGIGLAGLVALLSLLVETQLARRRGDLHAYTTDFAGVLRGSLGSYLVGFGAVCSAVGFPLDVYWHALYGIDVSLWAPFHTMIIMGSVLGTFGMFYILLSAAHLAQMQRSRWMARFSYAGVVVALGLLLSQLSTFITPAISDYTWHMASLSLNFFPALLAIVAVFICVLVGRLVPWTGAASMVVVVFLLIYLLVHAFVPPMMTRLIEAEHETYLAQASRIGATLEALRGQTPLLLLLPLSLDGLAWLARRGGWTLTRRNAWSLVAATVSMFLAAAFLTLLGLSADGVALSGIVVPELVLALLLTIPASVLAGWLAATMSGTAQKLWR